MTASFVAEFYPQEVGISATTSLPILTFLNIDLKYGEHADKINL